MVLRAPRDWEGRGPRQALAGKAEPWIPSPHGNWTQTQAGGRVGRGLGTRLSCSHCQGWARLPGLGECWLLMGSLLPHYCVPALVLGTGAI